MKKTILALALMCGLPVAAQAQDAEAGKTVFNVCKACHGIGPGAKNQVGPDLNGVLGRKAGTEEGFNYSEAMKNSGITWDEANLIKYVGNPKGTVPGNKMVFAGIKDEQKAKDLVAYLESFDKDGNPAKK